MANLFKAFASKTPPILDAVIQPVYEHQQIVVTWENKAPSQSELTEVQALLMGVPSVTGVRRTA